jgi:hypothetical protein
MHVVARKTLMVKNLGLDNAICTPAGKSPIFNKAFDDWDKNGM